MNKNDRFTSNTQKLIANLDRFLVFQKTRKLHPITLDVAPSNNCNLNCEFCSVKNRDKNVSLRLDQAIHCTEMYLKRGLKAVELTGGGEPLTWPYFSEYVEWCFEKGLKLGLITNGLLLHKIKPSVLEKFTWIRISLNAIDQLEDWFPIFEIPSNVIFSFNYVWTLETDVFEHIKLKKILESYPKATALKIQKNVFADFSLQRIPTFNDPRVFVSEKSESFIPPHCYMGWIKPHLHADGSIYRCSTSCLKHRKFMPEFIIGTWNNVSEFPDSKTFDTSICDRCFFVDQNHFVETIEFPNEHSEFV